MLEAIERDVLDAVYNRELPAPQQAGLLEAPAAQPVAQANGVQALKAPVMSPLEAAQNAARVQNSAEQVLANASSNNR
jgi:hypothetical protein